jgi:hypothetical protein
MLWEYGEILDLDAGLSFGPAMTPYSLAADQQEIIILPTLVSYIIRETPLFISSFIVPCLLVWLLT